MATGKIKVNTENIFPIIKKWLYSDRDIFIRELISNGCDAMTKRKKLAVMGQMAAPEGEYSVTLTVDKENKTLVFSDNGIGMSADEIKKYITQVAFSGAQEFLEQYGEDDKEKESDIIGHFGLGFYSAFMVADVVEIDSLSGAEGAAAAHWSCDGGVDYKIGSGKKKLLGTDITLHITPDNEDFLDYANVLSVVKKYCSFLPYNIYVTEAGKDEEKAPVNNPNPLWLKKPSDCTDEEYKQFYTEVFHDFEEPLFYIHLNVDYPFNLKGILYFPKIKHELSGNEGQIKLYNNQVFVADNIKEVIPEYLMLLKGCIDCGDLPLNVSRSFLQNDGYVKKVSAHITKKVCDKLSGMFKNDRSQYEGYWDDINPFIKFGCMKDESFYDKMSEYLLFKTTDDEYLTLAQLLEGNEDKKIIYVSDPLAQAQYITMLKAANQRAVILPYGIDSYFINFMEFKNQDVKFSRIDAGILDDMADKDAYKDEKLVALFKKAIGDDNLNAECMRLKDPDTPAIITVDEQQRRMSESSIFMGINTGLAVQRSVVLNLGNPVVQKLTEDNADAELLCNYIYDLAVLAHGSMTSEQMTGFLKNANKVMGKMI